MAYDDDVRLQDEFKNPDGSKLLDNPVRYHIVEYPQQPKETSYGDKYIVKLKNSITGTEPTWALDKKQIDRIFSNTHTGWQAQTGEEVAITYCSPSKPGGFEFYKAEPTGDVTPSAPTPPATPSATPQAPASPASTTTKWDGTPRQENYMRGLKDVMCSLIEAGKDPTDPSVQSMASDVFLWTREHGKELEVSYPNH